MQPSILKSTKKLLGIHEDYTVFDIDVMTHINAAFSVLQQLGVGPVDGYMIEDADDVWTDFDVPDNLLKLVRSYIFLKVKMSFDPSPTSFHLESMNRQIQELEWRMNVSREEALAASQIVVVTE